MAKSEEKIILVPVSESPQIGFGFVGIDQHDKLPGILRVMQY